MTGSSLPSDSVIKASTRNHEWYIALASGQAETLFLLILQKIESSQSHIDVAAGVIHRMIVIPKSRSGLIVRICVCLCVARHDHFGSKTV